MIPIDYHMHSLHSYDSRTSMAEMCDVAAQAGLREVCFTEHLDFDRSDPGHGHFNLDGYLASLSETRAAFAGRLVIRTGIEFDFRREYGRRVGDALGGMPLDFRLGSVHTVLGRRVYRFHKEPPDPAEARALQAAYFDEVRAAVESGCCNCIGHFDYLYKQCPTIFGPMRDAWYWERVEEIIDLCVARGVALEINTHHVLDRGAALAADREILSRYRSRGGRLLTVGSDSHRPDDVGQGYAEAAAALVQAGFAELTVFEAGRPRQVPVEL